MTWLLWRQSRFQTAVAGALLLALVALVLSTGVRMSPFPSPGRYDALVTLLRLTVALPLVLGVFFGATAIARETEHGTHVLAWTQSATRKRWTLGKLAVAVLTVVAVQAVVAAATTWWFGPFAGLDGGRFAALRFDIEGIVSISYALFAASLGLAAGAWFRRLLPAIGTTVGGFFVVRFGIEQWLRPHLFTAKTVLTPLGTPQRIPANAWMVGTDLIGPDGASLHGRIIGTPALCPDAVDRMSMNACMDRVGYHIKSVFHPASQYWPTQWIETGVFVALAAALLVGAYLLLVRRDA